MEHLLKTATEWKDFLWIIFTLIATLTTMITCARTKKTLQQPLYNKVLEKQIEALAEILEVLGESWGDFVCKCELQSMVAFNIIGHLEAMGCLENVEDEELQQVAQDFANLRDQRYEERDEETIEKILAASEGITIVKGNDFSYIPIQKEENKKEQILAGQQVRLLNGTGIYFQTRNFGRIFSTLKRQLGNVYLPKTIYERLSALYEAMDVFCGKTFGDVCKREEQRVIDAEIGEEIEIDFAKLNNELVVKFQGLQKEYEALRKEIRKFLKIDAQW